MIKNISQFLGMLVMIVSLFSCTNQEEIDIIYNQNVTLDVNILDMYENSGINISKFQTQVGSGDKPCTYVLLYDADGKFQYSIRHIDSSLRNVSLELKDLDRKEYTIIVMQSLMQYDFTDNTGEQFWNFTNVKDISEVRVQTDYYIIPWYRCLGIDVQKIDVRQSRNFKSTPKMAGSFVSFECQNLNKGGYTAAGFYFKDKAIGLNLNPDLEGHAKYGSSDISCDACVMEGE